MGDASPTSDKTLDFVFVDDLLNVPFDDALRRCPALVAYIEANSDGKEEAEELTEEFRKHWHPRDAPYELRQVLESILQGGGLSVDSLLELPFDEALQRCPGLAAYIEEKSEGDTSELMDEFRRHWHRENAPSELRQVLAQIVSPQGAADTTDGALGLPGDSLLPDAGLWAAADERNSQNNLPDTGGAHASMDRPHGHGSAGKSLSSTETIRREEEPADQEDHSWSELSAKVDALLALPFDVALRNCSELAKHIDAQEDPEGVAAEFQQHSGDPTMVPAELRSVLEELLSPDVAAANAAAAEAFRQRMSSITDDDSVAETSGEHKRHHSRL